MTTPGRRLSVDPNQSPRLSTSPRAFRTGLPLQAQDVQRSWGRRGSNASTMSGVSYSGIIERHSQIDDLLDESSQNAIATLVLPPIIHTGLVPTTQTSAVAAGFKPPTTRDIPPVALTNLPQVPSDAFRNYLQRVGPLLERVQRGRTALEPTVWNKKDAEMGKVEHSVEIAEGGAVQSSVTRPVAGRLPSSTPMIHEGRPGMPRRISSGQGRRNRNEPTPLSTIPAVYFEEDFHIENPRTFDVVSERAEIVRPLNEKKLPESADSKDPAHAPRMALATNAVLQEKLSWYMDTVELHLINNISTASGGFFAALGSLKELQHEAEQSVATIQGLRKDLQRLDKDVATSGLEVVAKWRRRENVRKLGQAATQMHKVVQNIKRADELVENGAFDEAADQMAKIGRLICGQADANTDDALIDLRPVKSLQALDSGLQELQLRIGTGYVRRFVNLLLDDLRQHVEKVPPSETLKRWSRQPGIPPRYMEIGEELRAKLLSSLNGLARAGHTAPATTAYREAVTKEMKSIIRKYLPSSSDDDADSMISTSTRGGKNLTQAEKSSILARNLRALDGQDAEKLLIGAYTSISEALRRLSTQTKILLDVTSSMHSPDSRSPTQNFDNANPHSKDRKVSAISPIHEELSQVLDMSSLLGQAVDTVQTQVTRVLKVRMEQTIQLSKDRFLRYFTLNRSFADECEYISGRGGQVLKGIVNAQITGFVQALGTSEAERTARTLDSDKWNTVDFTSEDEDMLRQVLTSMTADPPQWNKSSIPIWEELSDQPKTDSPPKDALDESTATGNTNPTPKAATKLATIDENNFHVVASASQLLATIQSFLSLTAVLPTMTPQISASLLEVLRTFNSRSCQLVLGAGAIRSTGLKNITSKHLALASQSLSFVIELVPYMRECVRRHLPSGQNSVLAEFDKLKRLYQDHQAGIHDKLVDILSTRCVSRMKALRETDFAAAKAGPDAAEVVPSPYMETLTKETLTLHRVLSRHLAEPDVSYIMRQIAMNYKTHMLGAFAAAASPPTATSSATASTIRRQLLCDAECFQSSLSKIPEFASLGNELHDLVPAAQPPVKSEEVAPKSKAADKPDSDPQSSPKPQAGEMSKTNGHMNETAGNV